MKKGFKKSLIIGFVYTVIITYIFYVSGCIASASLEISLWTEPIRVLISVLHGFCTVTLWVIAFVTQDTWVK